MSDDVKKSRPEFRNIGKVNDIWTNYRWPITALASGFHRFSGLLLFLLAPVALYLLELSLVSEGSFAQLKELSTGWFVKLVLLALAWGFVQHFCTGIRHLFMDMHIGLDKKSARGSATRVLALTSTVTVLIALKLFGAF